MSPGSASPTSGSGTTSGPCSATPSWSTDCPHRLESTVWRIEDATVAPASDLARFVATVEAQRDFFDTTVPILVARAPGRLDLMGGIADYSGALVLQLPLAAATFVAAQRADDGCITIKSLALGPDAEAVVSLPATELVPASNGTPLDYTDARALFAKTA